MVAGKFSLKGKNVLVAGNSRYWTKYLAVALVEAGANLAIATGDRKKCAEAADEVRKLGKVAVTITADLTDASHVQKVVDETIKEFRNIDILVNANDVWFARPLIDVTVNEWKSVMDANLTSLFLCCQTVGKHMLEQNKGKIINLASCLAERGLANASVYCAAMGGVLQFTRAAAIEWARSGITVNAIGLGWFSEVNQVETAQEDRLVRYIPVKRYGHPEEIGSLAVYLASDAANFVTGQMMYVDGAITLHM